MSALHRRLMPVLLLAAAWLGPGAANACVTFTDVTLSQAYNPFAAGNYSQTFTVTGTRQYNGFYGWPTSYAATLDKLSSDPRPYNIYLIMDSDGGSGQQVMFNNPPAPGFPSDSQIDLYWAAGPGPNTITFQLQIQIPTGQDWASGTTDLVIGDYYKCGWSNNYPYAPAYRNSALTLHLNVISAVQASLVGQTLDFGELSSYTDAFIASAPGSITTRNTNLRVASSGPYQVTATSANTWAMTPNGGGATQANQKIRYQLQMLGQTVDSSKPTFTTVSCVRAGVGGQLIATTAKIQQGGVGKVASSTYQDVITITVTPVDGTGGSACS
jgi:hypothetical protein